MPDEQRVALLFELRQQAKEIDARIKELNAEVVSEGLDTFTTDAFKVSVRRSKRRMYNVERLEAMLKERGRQDLFDAVTIRIVDPEEFEKEFNKDNLDDEIIRETVTTVTRGPAVYITQRKDVA